MKQEEEFTLPKGSVLKLTGLGGEITREDIKEVGQTNLQNIYFTLSPLQGVERPVQCEH